ncbi:nucleotide sugar dehydrogenase [Paenibacillus roseipurpureus]|uniref:Nucleotide sugar dehydrogenase n=1 Tax=Paenibacillus roseopurpureus TaxID=2918901 RepID=A0AA96LK76_9BACL|nr:nucleotide sugar dehydrogenase [Paenibacillus sp. MBLB1832]WNR43427.1 nucleotide sugar dehydrogenase [Paenibacillus sp. MBLB1832]
MTIKRDVGETGPRMRTIAIIGLGYVGLPLVLHMLKNEYSVVGFDVDAQKISALRAGTSYITEIGDFEIVEALSTGRLAVTDRYQEMGEADAFIVCVPTPLSERGTPELSYLTQAVSEISLLVPKGKLIVLESSTYPGTTREVVAPILERIGLTIGQDVYLAYSPERIDPGNKDFPCHKIPKVVGGMTPACLERVEELYRGVFPLIHSVSTVETAEMAKIMENAYRLVNISFVNELAIICDELNLDIWEVIEAAKTKPFGFTGFYPGPGIGGHCIPVDPIYLEWKIGQYGLGSEFIQLSQSVNHRMPQYIAGQIQKLLNTRTLQHTRMLVYGAAYKKDIADSRESSALELMQVLQNLGAHVVYHDPYIPHVKVGGELWDSVELRPELLAEMDAVILATDHSSMPLSLILAQAKLVYDTRNATHGYEGVGMAKVVRLGGGGH